MTDKPLAPSSESEFLPRELSAPSPQRDMVLKLLESEISLLTQRQKNSGWTSWALVGAIGAIAWTLLGQWETGWPTGEKWSLSYVTISCVGEMVTVIIGLLRGNYSTPGGITRFRLGSQKSSRISLAFVFAQYLVLSLLIFGSKSFSSPTKLVAGAVAGLGCAFSLLGLVIAFTRFPTMASPSKGITGLTYKTVVFVVVPLLTFLFTPAFLTVRELIDVAPAAVDIKIGGLLFAMTLLIREWLDEANNQPLIDNLLTIRREVSLGGMSVEEAARHIEMEFLGMRVSDVFRDSAQEFIKHAARISFRCKDSIMRIDAIGLLSPSGIGVPVSLRHQQIILAQTLLDACRPQVAEIVKDLNQLQDKFRRIESRGRFFLRSSDDVQAAMQEILSRLNQSHREAYSGYQELEARMNRLSIMVATPSTSDKQEVA